MHCLKLHEITSIIIIFQIIQLLDPIGRTMLCRFGSSKINMNRKFWENSIPMHEFEDSNFGCELQSDIEAEFVNVDLYVFLSTESKYCFTNSRVGSLPVSGKNITAMIGQEINIVVLECISFLILF